MNCDLKLKSPVFHMGNDLGRYTRLLTVSERDNYYIEVDKCRIFKDDVFEALHDAWVKHFNRNYAGLSVFAAGFKNNDCFAEAIKDVMGVDCDRCSELYILLKECFKNHCEYMYRLEDAKVVGFWNNLVDLFVGNSNSAHWLEMMSEVEKW